MGISKFSHFAMALIVTLFVGHAVADDPFANSAEAEQFCRDNPESCPGASARNSTSTYRPASVQVPPPATVSDESQFLGQKSNQEITQAASDPKRASYVSACLKAIASARDSCDPEKDGSLAGKVKEASVMTNQISNMAAGMHNAACSKFGQAIVGAQGALAGFQANCGMKQSRCQVVCSAEMFPQTNKECVFYKGVQAQAIQNVMGAMTMIQGVKACGKALGSEFARMCKESPNLPMCMTAVGLLSCDDPTVAASNVTCICQANPMDPRCGSVDSSSQWASNPGVNSDPGGGPPSDPFASGFGDLMGADELAFGTPSEGGDNQMARGNLGRGGGGIGGSGTGNAGGAGGGRGGSGLNADILKGSYGGRGGAAGGAGGGFGGDRDPQVGYGAAGAGAGENIDLKKFLPGGKMDPSRGLAGVSGPDGITGPNSDIWKKIRTRYFSVSSSMRP